MQCTENDQYEELLSRDDDDVFSLDTEAPRAYQSDVSEDESENNEKCVYKDYKQISS